jgi:GNAT superfamily N-acetyltransferase
MTRQAPRIRDAGPQDAFDLLHLWAAVSGLGENLAIGRTHTDAEQALATIAIDPDQRLLVAEHDEDGIVAAMKLSRGPLWPLALDQAVHSSFLLVLPQYRRHGYGHALMDAALTWAEEKDITQITVVTDGNRDTNRFFARLGLSTLGNVRYANTAGLRKKLSTERVRGGNRHLVEVLAQRRSMRRRQGAG